MKIRICENCKERPARKVNASSDKYRKFCRICERRMYGGIEARRRYRDRTRSPYREHLKESCELCGFIPVNVCQLDIDHIDGNHSNNSLDNLQTLCANCHRLKTFLNRDWENKKHNNERK